MSQAQTGTEQDREGHSLYQTDKQASAQCVSYYWGRWLHPSYGNLVPLQMFSPTIFFNIRELSFVWFHPVHLSPFRSFPLIQPVIVAAPVAHSSCLSRVTWQSDGAYPEGWESPGHITFCYFPFGAHSQRNTNIHVWRSNHADGHASAYSLTYLNYIT